MARKISTTTNPIGYWVSLPEHIEEIFGSYFENLIRCEQMSLLSALSYWRAYHNNDGDEDYSLMDAYYQIPGGVSGEVEEILPELEQLERTCSGTIFCFIEALVANIRYTHVTVEDTAA